MTPAEATAALHAPATARGEELVQVRAGAFRLLLPMGHVERIFGAAIPTALPDACGRRHPVVALRGELVPVLFAGALMGEGDVRLRAGDQMVLLSDGRRRALLWVDAVEDVVPWTPGPGPAGGLVAGFAGAERPLPILDVPAALAFAADDDPEGA